jgi:hypothetical protein
MLPIDELAIETPSTPMPASAGRLGPWCADGPCIADTVAAFDRAKRTSKGMRVIGVRSLDEALVALGAAGCGKR